MFKLRTKTATSWGAFEHSGDFWKKDRGAPEAICVTCFLRFCLSLFFCPSWILSSHLLLSPLPFFFFYLACLPLISQLLGFLFQVTPNTAALCPRHPLKKSFISEAFFSNSSFPLGVLFQLPDVWGACSFKLPATSVTSPHTDFYPDDGLFTDVVQWSQGGQERKGT